MKQASFLTLLIALSACSGEPEGNQVARDASDGPVASAPIATPDAAASPDLDPAPGSSPATGPVVTRIPAAFLGEWNRTRADCGVEGSETRLRIEPDRLVFYESVGSVIAVTGLAPQITVRARYAGEGETWESARTLRLSADGQMLKAEGMSRVRCP